MFSFFIVLSFSNYNDNLTPVQVQQIVFDRSGLSSSTRTVVSATLIIRQSFFFGLSLSSGNGGAVSVNDLDAEVSISDTLYLQISVLNGLEGALYCIANDVSIERVGSYRCHAHASLNAFGQFAYFQIQQSNGIAKIIQTRVIQCAFEFNYNSPRNTRSSICFQATSTNSEKCGSFLVEYLNQSSCWANSYSGMILVERGKEADFNFCYFFNNHQMYSSEEHMFDHYNFGISNIQNCNFIKNVGETQSLIGCYRQGSYSNLESISNVIFCYFAENNVKYLFRGGRASQRGEIYVINSIVLEEQSLSRTGTVSFSSFESFSVSVFISNYTIFDLFHEVYDPSYSAEIPRNSFFTPSSIFTSSNDFTSSYPFSPSNYFKSSIPFIIIVKDFSNPDKNSSLPLIIGLVCGIVGFFLFCALAYLIYKCLKNRNIKVNTESSSEENENNLTEFKNEENKSEDSQTEYQTPYQTDEDIPYILIDNF